MRVKFGISPDEYLAHLTMAAHRVALEHGLRAPFLPFQLELEEALRKVIRRDMTVTDFCGLFTICQEASCCEPWSPEAEGWWDEAV